MGCDGRLALGTVGLEQAVAADPQDGEAWALLGEAHQENAAEGEAELDKVLALDPSSASVHGLRGPYWKRRGQSHTQLAEYQAAAQLEPTNAEWQADVGEAYATTSDQASAIASHPTASTLPPDSATHWSPSAIFCADNDIRVLYMGLPAAPRPRNWRPTILKCSTA